jgi:hypothetical protein
MPKKISWTEAQDLRIRRLRAEGSSWDEISDALGHSRWTVIERARRIGARPPPAGFPPQPDDPGREPLPAGSAASWGAITEGTTLQGVPYKPIRPR